MKEVDIVFHLTALIAIPFSYHSSDSYIDINVKGTLNIIHAARENKVKRSLVTSTSLVYGTAQFVPITELHPKQPQSPYSASKIGADIGLSTDAKEIRQVAAKFGIETSFGRPKKFATDYA